MTHEIYSATERSGLKGTLTLGALSLASMAALVAAAEANATVNNRRNLTAKADVVSHIRPGEHSTFVIPGYHSNGRVIADHLDRHLEHTGTTHYAIHPEKGFDLDSIREAWLRARKLDGHRPTRIYALSMGALLSAYLLSEEGLLDEFGEIDTFAIDCGLSGKGDLSTTTKLAALGGLILPETYSTNKFYKFVNGQDLKKPIDHGAEVARNEALERIRSSAETPFSAGRPQLWFMHTHDIGNMDLSELGKRVKSVRYIAPTRDDVVNTWQSANKYSRSLNREIEYWVDTHRAPGTHASGIERPRGAVDVITNQHRDSYRINSIGKDFLKASVMSGDVASSSVPKIVALS